MANSLIHESSPYLLQHAYNPVQWYAWNEVTLEKAGKEDKMLLISIGYAACHWCHVMERESFENEKVAALMNKYFICIKVDREERPDIDQVYMDAAYLISGSGGWPLNALAMSDGRPFFAGAYYPPDNWMQLLQYFADIYRSDRSKLEEQANDVSAGIKNIEIIPLNKAEVEFGEKDLHELSLHLKKRLDRKFGGILGKMKFPMPAVWLFLMKYHYHTQNQDALNLVKLTLDNMALGGIYDQIGGGFSRYATDPEWHVPHFEKMLYDNAQLVVLYAQAYQLTKDPLYKKVVYGTLNFVLNELSDPRGGFFSSIDADSEGEEGKFYVWTEEKIDSVLGKEDADLFKDYYGFTSAGNWESGKNIPDINFGKKTSGSKEFISPPQEKLATLNRILFEERCKRPKPATDNKILTSWNALMALGFIEAYKAFGEESFFYSAKRNIDFLLKNVYNADHSLYRNFMNDKASTPAFLDDYAFLIAALIGFYQVSFEEEYLYTALNITEYVQIHFFDSTSGMYFYTDDRYSELIVRKTETTDNVIPSSNSEMAKNLLFLSGFFGTERFKQQAIQMLKNVKKDVISNPGYYSNWALALTWEIYEPVEVAIVGRHWTTEWAEISKAYIPDVLFTGGAGGTLPLLQGKDTGNETLIYVCRNKSCSAPVKSAQEAVKLLSG